MAQIECHLLGLHIWASNGYLRINLKVHYLFFGLTYLIQLEIFPSRDLGCEESAEWIIEWIIDYRTAGPLRRRVKTRRNV